jgi:hypothetical protein
MARRSQFRGVAHNLVQWSLSRNNDYLGYWALGQLYSFAIQKNCREITFNIIENCIYPETHAFFELHASYFNIITNNAHKNGIWMAWLKEAKIIFKFDVEYQDKYHFFGSALGEPMTCTVVLTTDLGRKYCFTSGCNIRPHDPKREYCRSAL